MMIHEVKKVIEGLMAPNMGRRLEALKLDLVDVYPEVFKDSVVSLVEEATDNTAYSGHQAQALAALLLIRDLGNCVEGYERLMVMARRDINNLRNTSATEPEGTPPLEDMDAGWIDSYQEWKESQAKGGESKDGRKDA